MMRHTILNFLFFSDHCLPVAGDIVMSSLVGNIHVYWIQLSTAIVSLHNKHSALPSNLITEQFTVHCALKV